MSDAAQDFKTSLTETIQRLITIFGPSIVLAKIKNIQGLTISDDGTVLSTSGDQDILKKHIQDQFEDLSSTLAGKIFDTPQLTVNHKD